MHIKRLFRQAVSRFKKRLQTQLDEAKEVTTKDLQSVVFVNKPITSIEDDVLFYSAQADAVLTAINTGARIIGVIADYGTGKTSLTEIIRLKRKEQEPPIIINLWDSLSRQKNSEATDDAKSVSGITQSFLYQLACGCSNGTSYARNVSRRLSRNYGVLSVSTTSKWFWLWIAAAFLVYSIPQVVLLTVADVSPLFEFSLNFLSPWVAIAVAVCGVIRTNIAFSLWDSQGKRQPEASDTYSLFTEIVEELCRREDCQRYVIIEDLDRVSSKSIVIGFLKEIYKFHSMLTPEYQNRMVFVISVKQEHSLVDQEQATAYGDHIYTKIFDYTVVLSPIHTLDYSAVAVDILRPSREKIEKIADISIGEELPSEFSWIVRGENLTVRDIKNRLNICFSIYERLIKRTISDECLSIQMGKCAAVAYLLDCYPEQMAILLQNESKFDALVIFSKTSNVQRKYGKLKQDEQERQLEEKLGEVLPNGGKSFREEIVALLIGQYIEDDYRQYFYTYPKHSRIPTVAEYRVRRLILTNEALDSEIEKDISSVRATNRDTIIAQLQLLVDQKTGLPSSIYFCKDLFEVAYEEFPEVILDELSNKKLLWESRYLDESKRILAYIRNDVDGKYHDVLLKGLSERLAAKLAELDADQISSIRKILIPIWGTEMIYSHPLYYCDGMPIIQAEEMALLKNEKLVGTLTNINLIDENSANSIARWFVRSVTSEAFGRIEAILEKCLSEDENCAENILQYLCMNHRYNGNMFCRIVKSSVCNNKKIVEYLNTFDPNEVSANGWACIEKNLIYGGYKEDIRGWLLTDMKYCVALLDWSTEQEIPKRVFNQIDIPTLYKAMDIIFNTIEKAFTIIRCSFPSFLMRNTNKLYAAPYPIICGEELNKCTSLPMLEKLVDFQRLEPEQCKTISAVASRLAPTSKRCRRLLERFLLRDGISAPTREALLWGIDFSLVPFGELQLVQQEQYVARIREFHSITDGRSALLLMKHLRTPIISLEEQILGEKSDQKVKLISEYYSFISQVQLYTKMTLAICEQYWISVPMWEEFEDALFQDRQFDSFLTARILRTNRLSMEELPKEINLSIIAETMSGSQKCRAIISNNDVCMKEIMNTPDVYEQITGRAIFSFARLRQKTGFIKYAFSVLKDDEKYEYIRQMMDLDTQEDSDAFFEFMCEDDNLRLARQNRDFRLRVGHRLYGCENASIKRRYYRTVNSKP